MKYINTIISLTIISIALQCNTNDGPSIVVGSHTFNESTIKSDNREFYDQLREQYNQQMHQTLKRAAMQKMIEMAADKNDQTAQEYMQSKIESIPAPTDEELKMQFEEMSAMGLLGKQSFDSVKVQLKKMILDEKREEIVAVEIGKLRKKYSYKDSFEIKKDIEAKDARIRGNKDASVTIIEFSDFECSYCARSQKTSKKLRKMYGSKIRFAFYDFPLNFHKNAMHAHIAGICINNQSTDSFWKYVDVLFARQQVDRSAIVKNNVDKLALSLGINQAKYNSCVADPAMKAQVEKSIKLGASVGVRGTPAFFINGRFINGAAPLSDFVAIIEEEIN